MHAPRLEHWNPNWGELTLRSMREHLESQGYSVVRYAYSPGTRFDDHTHEADKKDAVVSGCFKICVERDEFLLKPGDMIEIPAGIIHSAEVIGDEIVVSLDATRR
jgi:quercetin dioxygenase-like cupin family protein